MCAAGARHGSRDPAGFLQQGSRLPHALRQVALLHQGLQHGAACPRGSCPVPVPPLQPRLYTPCYLTTFRCPVVNAICQLCTKGCFHLSSVDGTVSNYLLAIAATILPTRTPSSRLFFLTSHAHLVDVSPAAIRPIAPLWRGGGQSQVT